MQFVINSSPLIFLAKLDALWLLQEDSLVVPNIVSEEILKKENIEKDRFKLFLAEKHVTIIFSWQEREFSKMLGKGEMAVIQIALEEKISHVLLDDKRAWSLAKLHRLHPKGTLWILLRAFQKKIITQKQTKQFIYDLPGIGFYIEEKLLMQILQRIEA